jgi:hypothetical protein
MPLRDVKYSEACSDFRQSSVQRPQPRSAVERRGRQKMNVDVPDSTPVERSAFDEGQCFVVSRTWRLRKAPKMSQYLAPAANVAAGQLSSDERVDQHFLLLQGRNESQLTAAEVLDPDRRVNEDHTLPGRRRGTDLALGSLPPSRASRRALSREMSARRPS